MMFIMDGLLRLNFIAHSIWPNCFKSSTLAKIYYAIFNTYIFTPLIPITEYSIYTVHLVQIPLDIMVYVGHVIFYTYIGMVRIT